MKLPGTIEHVEIVRQEPVSNPEHSAYLTLWNLGVQNTYTDGSKSAVYRYEAVLRKWLDAVVLVLIAEIEEVLMVCMRTSIRPPILLRSNLSLPQPDSDPQGTLLELPAGLIEDEDRGPEGVLRRAAAETLEETGYDLPLGAFSLLGSGVFVSPGVIPERMIFLSAAVPDYAAVQKPEGDGSPLEEGSDILWVGVDEALKMCDNGAIVDMKTELGIRRLASKLQGTGR